MKKVLLFLLILLASTTSAIAIIIGIETPPSYIHNLKNCTPSTAKTQGSNGVTYQFEIKGLLPNGKCEVNIIETENSDEILGILKNFSGNLKNSFKVKYAEPNITTCKFSKSERDKLIAAYYKHDDKYETIANTKIFDKDKMSSYDKLMYEYYDDICISNQGFQVHKNRKFICEYADATCTYEEHEDGSSENFCSKSKSEFKMQDFSIYDKVKKHVEAGYCRRVY